MATYNVFPTHKLSSPIKYSTSFLFSCSSYNLFNKSRKSYKLCYPVIKAAAKDKEEVVSDHKISVVSYEEKDDNKEEVVSDHKISVASYEEKDDNKEEVVSDHKISVASYEEKDDNKNGFVVSKAINACIVLGFGSLVVTRLLTIDQEYWHGWTLYEILRYAPEHNWTAYEEALKENPVFAKMVISGIVYSLGDWIAQCYEGKPLFEFDRTRLFRSGLVGFALHGSLSHYYYQICEALIPSKDWWVVPAKIAFDQTAWSAVWNSIYFVVLGLLRFESPDNLLNELKTTFFPLLTAGWKLWPFAHLITYGVIPVEQRLLWVDCVELVWVTILSTYSNEKSEARISDTASDSDTSSSSKKQ